MKKQIVLLNTSILTSYGTFSYQPMSLERVKERINSFDFVGGEPLPVLSAIGHQSTADILSELLEIPVEVNRINYRQELDDLAIVFKLKGRPLEGAILSREEIEAIGYEFGFLTRLA